MDVVKVLLIYFGLMNLGGFLAFGIDKSRSVRSKWRIPEATLFSFAILGGGVGCFLGMQVFHHKTMKPAFYIGIPAILIAETLIVLYLLFLSPIKFMIQ